MHFKIFNNNNNCLFHQKTYLQWYKKNCHKVKPTNKLLGSLFGTNEILDKRAIRSLTKTSGTS